MKNPKGLIPIIVVVFITIIAAGVVGMAWYYNQNKQDDTTQGGLYSVYATQEECEAAHDCSCRYWIHDFSDTENGWQCDPEIFTNANTSLNTNSNTNTTNVDTSDWQTYTNDELGVRFEYPSSGNVVVTEFDSTQTKEENSYPTTGKAISMSVTFSDKSKIYVIGSSSDYSRIYSESYNGGEDLSTVCSNPGVIENESYCSNISVADQDTYKKVYFEAPECSPMFVQESKLNLDKNGYVGLRIHQTFFTNGGWDCTSPTEEFNAVTDSEIKRLFSGAELTEEETKKFEDFDRFLSSIQLTS